jgi:hypothetical protein
MEMDLTPLLASFALFTVFDVIFLVSAVLGIQLF